jgi:hypothetical protein
MDPITEQILLEAKIIDSIRKIAPIAKNAVIKGNVNTMKRIAKSLPSKDFKTVEKEAMKKLPGFKEKYKNMQRMMIRNPDAKGIEQPAALIGAVAAVLTDNVTPELIVMKLSEAAKNAQKLIFFPGDIKLLKLILFLLAILAVYATRGAVVLPAVQYLFTGMSFLASLLAKMLGGAAKIIEVGRDRGPEAVASVKSIFNDIMGALLQS